MSTSKGFGVHLAVTAGAAFVGSIILNVVLGRIMLRQQEVIDDVVDILDSAGDGIVEVRRALAKNNKADGDIAVDEALSDVECDISNAYRALVCGTDFGVGCCDNCYNECDDVFFAVGEDM